MNRLKDRNRKVFWVEKIALADILRFLAQSCFDDIKVNYDKFQVYPSAGKFLGILERAGLNRIFHPVGLTLQRLDEEGSALTYRVHKEVDVCIEEFIVKRIPQETRRFKDMLKAYMAVRLEDKVTFITMVGSEVNLGKTSSVENNIIYLVRQPLNYLLREFYRDRKFDIKQSFPSSRNIKFYLMPFYYLAQFLLCKLRNPKVKSNISQIRPAIWAEYYPGYIHAFWMNMVKCEGFDIVSYLDRGDTQLTPEAIREIEGHNSKWIDAHFPSLLRMSGLNFSALWKLLPGLFSVYFSKPVWLKAFRFEYTFFSLIYGSVFANYKVKVLIQHQDCSWIQEVQALAVERAGGIMVGYHWSAYAFYMLPTHLFPQHVFFVWGKYMSEMLRKKNSICRYILPSGMWIVPDGRDPGRKGIFSEKVNFVLSVFDSSVAYNLYQSQSSLGDFYLRVFNIIENNQRFGCIIKSKNPLQKTLLSIPMGERVLEKIEILKGQRRLEVLDFSESPFAAALSSDLSVGYGINSACTVVAIAGDCAAISWDCAGLKRHPFHKYPGQKIVFKSLEELEEAILKVSEGDKTIGDYNCWKKHVNYFEDHNAANRIADFLESYMKESVGTGDAGHSLDFAVNKYLDDNKVGEDFYKNEALWVDE